MEQSLNILYSKAETIPDYWKLPNNIYLIFPYILLENFHIDTYTMNYLKISAFFHSLSYLNKNSIKLLSKTLTNNQLFFTSLLAISHVHFEDNRFRQTAATNIRGLAEQSVADRSSTGLCLSVQIVEQRHIPADYRYGSVQVDPRSTPGCLRSCYGMC